MLDRPDISPETRITRSTFLTTMADKFGLGGAVALVGAGETAFADRGAPDNLAIIARWIDPAEADRHVAWARGLREAMRLFAHGVYVNYLGVGDEADRVLAAYGPEKYARLAAIKATYDPDNVFRLNQNIRPAP